MSACPTEVWGLTDGSPGYQFALFMTIFSPLAMIVFLAVFLYYKDSSVLLRKRSNDLNVICIVASFALWGCTALYDVIGSELYPCWLYVALVYFSVPMIAGPIMLKAARYIQEVSYARLTKGEMLLAALEQDSEPGDRRGLGALPTMWESFKCYVKLFLGNRDRQVRIRSARFTSSNVFTYAWLLFSTLPYLIVYFIRLATTPEWREGCSGCELGLPDAAFLLAFYLYGTILFGIQVPLRISASSRDALRIKRECAIAWVGTGFWISLAMLLFIIDPNRAYVESRFNFRILGLFGVLHAIYVQTVHQVIVAKRLQRRLLASPNFNRADLFMDVMHDKELSQKLRNFLHGELSSEIMLFLDAVDAFRRDFEVKKESRQRMGRHIYDEFIVRRAPNEINLSYEVQKVTATRVERGNMNVNVFDEAYTEIKDMLLKDGFTRFLSSIRVETTARNNTTTVANVGV